MASHRPEKQMISQYTPEEEMVRFSEDPSNTAILDYTKDGLPFPMQGEITRPWVPIVKRGKNPLATRSRQNAENNIRKAIKLF